MIDEAVIEDMLVDGRNRVRGAQEAGVEDNIPVVVLPPNADAVAVVASLNIHRRHLTPGQRAHAAAGLIRLNKAAYTAKHPDEPGAEAFKVFDEPPDDALEPADEKLAGVPAEPGPVRDPDGEEHYGDPESADAVSSGDTDDAAGLPDEEAPSSDPGRPVTSSPPAAAPAAAGSARQPVSLPSPSPSAGSSGAARRAAPDGRRRAPAAPASRAAAPGRGQRPGR